MGLLEAMLGEIGDTGGPCKFTSDRYEPTFTVSTESHDVAYAIPASAEELDALARLVRTERETPYVEDGNDSLSAALESVLDEGPVDAEAWVERMAEPRRTVEPILETWQELADDGDDGTPERESDGDSADGGETSEDATGREETSEGATESDLGREFDVHIVYLPVGMESAVASFFELCRRRDERESDPFEFPDDVTPAATLLSRINATTERAANRVVVNTRHLPL